MDEKESKTKMLKSISRCFCLLLIIQITLSAGLELSYYEKTEIQEALNKAPRCCIEGSNYVQNKCPGVSHPDFSCPNGRYTLEDDDMKLINGKIIAYSLDETEQFEFCVMDKNIRNQTLQVAIACFSENVFEDNFLPNIICCTVSIICLALTFAVYVLVPDLRDLQGKCLMCLIVCLAIAMSTLVTMQSKIMPDLNTFCIGMGYFLYFWLMSSFLWLNVVAINLWRSVRFHRHVTSEKKMFLYYNVYAWGLSFSALIILLCFEHIPGNHRKPYIGLTRCWFHDPYSHWLFLYSPICVILIVNVFSFIDTALQLWRDYKELSPTSKLRSLRYKCLLYLKLFVVMGIAWIFEPLSFLVVGEGESPLFWTITDYINMLQGVFIFILLILLRKRALRGLANTTICGLRWVPASWANMHHLDEECEDILAQEIEEGQLSPVVSRASVETK